MPGSCRWAPDDEMPGILSWMAVRARKSVIVADTRKTSRQVHAAMRERGAHWRHYAAGHDSCVWRGARTEGLILLYGTK